MSLRHILTAILIAALWGANIVVVKVGLNELPPLAYGAGRFVLSALPIFFVSRPTVSWKLIGAIGLTLGVFKFTLMFFGMHLGMSAGLASLILQSQIFFTVVLSVLLYKSQMRAHQLMGMMVAMIGIVLIALQMHVESTLLGFACILGSAMSWATSNLLYRRAGQVDMLSLTVWTSLIPPIPLILASFWMEGPEVIISSFQHMSYVGGACLLFTACGSTLIGTTLWGTLLKHYDAVQVAPFSLLIPVFSMLLSWLFLNEQFSATTLLACVLVFLGLVVNQWQMPFKLMWHRNKRTPLQKDLEQAA